MSAAIKNALTLDKIIITMLTAPTDKKAVAEARILVEADQPLTWREPNTNFDLRKSNDEGMFFTADWMDRAYDPVTALEVSPELRVDHERETRLCKAHKAQFSLDNPWRDELPITPFWYLTGGLDWAEENLLAFAITVAEASAKRANNGYMLAVAATKNPIIEPTELPPYKPTKEQRRAMKQRCHPWCEYGRCISPEWKPQMIGPVTKAVYDLPKNGPNHLVLHENQIVSGITVNPITGNLDCYDRCQSRQRIRILQNKERVSRKEGLNNDEKQKWFPLLKQGLLWEKQTAVEEILKAHGMPDPKKQSIYGAGLSSYVVYVGDSAKADAMLTGSFRLQNGKGNWDCSVPNAKYNTEIRPARERKQVRDLFILELPQFDPTDPPDED